MKGAEMDSLAGRTAIVTGGARGNGFAIAEGLAGRGCSVWLFDIDADGVRTAAEELGRAASVQSIVVDVSDPDSVASAFRTLTEAGDVADVLVNNAGIMPQTSFLELTAEEYRRVVAVNLDAVVWCSQEFGRRLVSAERHGAIVNLSSMAARIAPPNTSAYCASKGGLSALTRAMAVDLAPYGIRVNDIAPGVILTDMNRHLFDAEGATEARMLTRIPIGRIGASEDLAGVVAFLASDHAAYITGVSIPVDGGYLVR